MADDDFDSLETTNDTPADDAAQAVDTGAEGSSEGAAASPPPAAPAAPAAPASFYERARAAGMPFESDDQALAEFVAAREQLRQAQAWQAELEQIKSTIAPQWGAFQQWQQQQAAPQQPKVDPAASWRAPQLPDDWRNYYQQDENGRWTMDPATPLDVRNQIQAHIKWKQDHEKRLANLPDSLQELGVVTKADLERLLEERENRVLERFQTEFAGRDMAIAMEKHLEGMRGKFIGKDGKHTPYYHAFQARAKQLEATGRYSQPEVANLAAELADADVARKELETLRAQMASRTAAGLPAVAGAPSRVAPSQSNPSQPVQPTIQSVMDQLYGDMEKDLFSQPAGAH